ncbi:TetR/AcrR family transcriptional regulator [Spirilliplanes yamanashiensis]|uniref:TetR family transcriptional regulator n=1 Tax=Spirilliplanes yamanashiensis TaxID=42233 RepID=A0A8J4DIU3_9ACTN|nr:TetR-like C-terminal domain-containing protein [Spirilliplanes yamanashiensis]MDP9816882.1 AcrR family transcriptional regulator [Spirilliplanes yamanashiensis]GIJ03462.1 TetR family transcriptional regulator [Spirilliplanes yamanashiensis]
MSAASLRARVRAEMTDEIKAVARRHLAADGANLSLRAVARDLGMASSAVYRYVASRDDLLTWLIIDAYDAVGAAAEAAEAAVDRADFTGRWLATCHAVREWALANPHEYALIYGSPVPGYRAPADTVAPATRVGRLMGRILADARPDPGEPVEGPLAAELDAVAAEVAPGVSAAAMGRGMAAWIHLFGAVSFELFGQLANAVDERRAFFDLQMRGAAAVMGLARAPGS